MELPKEYFVIYKDSKGKVKDYYTNNVDTAEKKAMLNSGIVYTDTRYKAKLRLYWYLWRKKEYEQVQYTIKHFEDYGTFNCIEVNKVGIKVLIGYFEKFPTKDYEFIKDNQCQIFGKNN